MVFGFGRKKSAFTSERVELGRTRPKYLHPNKQEMTDIMGGERLTYQPYFHGLGVTHPKKSTKSKKQSATKKKKGPSRAELLRRDFINYAPRGTDDFTGFAKVGGYDSQSHLGRNLNFKI